MLLQFLSNQKIRYVLFPLISPTRDAVPSSGGSIDQRHWQKMAEMQAMFCKGEVNPVCGCFTSLVLRSADR
jgi:hypothetical protein